MIRWDPILRDFVWQTDVQQYIKLHNPFTPDSVNYGFYDDGTEAGAALFTAQDQTEDLDVSAGNVQFQLRVQIDETGTDTAGSNENYSLEYELNDSTTWVPITTTSAAVQVDTGSTLTDGVATTDRLTGGTGSFDAGEVDGGTGATGTTGALDVPGISNHTEIVWGLNLIASALADNDTVDFRVLDEGTTFAASMGEPRITITKGATVTPLSIEASATGAATIAKRGQFFRTLGAAVTGVVKIVRMFFRTLKPGGGGYEANAVTFDGSTEYLSGVVFRASDYRYGIVSLWFRRNSTGTDQYFFGTVNARFGLGFQETNHIHLRLATQAGGEIWGSLVPTGSQITSSAITDGDWHHIVVSWDTQNSTGGDVEAFLDGVNLSLAAGASDGDQDHDRTSTIGNRNAGVDQFDGDMAEMYFNFAESSYFDLNTAGNVEKFRSASGFPVDLGSDGSTPTGTQPNQYFKNPAASVGTNSGSAANWTANGTPVDAGSSPSDGNSGGGAIATLSRVFMTNRSFSATTTAVATLAFSLFFNRIISATSTGVATLLKHFSTVDFSATVTGLAEIARHWLALRIFSAKVTASATIVRRLRAFREFSATVTGIATLIIAELGGGVTAITLAATATVLATLRKMEFRTLSAVDTALATIARRWLAFRTFNATVTGSATIARLGQFFRTFNATATGLATFLKNFSTVDFSATVTGVATFLNDTINEILLAASATAQATLRKMEFRTLSVVTTGAVTFLKNFSTILFEAKTGSLAVKADFIRFDGVSTFVEWATGPTTASDGRAGTFAIPFNREGGTGEQCIFYIGTTTGESIYVGFNATNNLVARISDGAAQTLQALTSTTAYSDSVDRVAVFSFDLDTNKAWLKVNTTDVEKQTPTLDAGSATSGGAAPLFTVILSAKTEALPVLRSLTVNAADIDFTDTWRFGSTDDSGDRQWYSGSAGHVYGELGYHDPEDINLFYSAEADGPRDHGPFGNEVTGITPPLYWIPTADNPLVNNGSGGNADTASSFSDETSIPTLLVNPATMARRASYRKTFDAAATGSAVLLRLAQFFRIMAATVTGLATLIVEDLGGGFTLFTRTISATATGLATLLRRGQFFRTLSAVATGVATLLLRGQFFRTISATVTGSARLLRMLFVDFAATVTGLATLIVEELGSGLTAITVAATATAQATIERLALFRRIFNATATGLATIVRMLSRTLSAAVTGTALILLSGLFSRIFSATVTGVATLERLFRALRTLSATLTGLATLARLALLRRTLEATATAQATIVRLAIFRRIFNATVTGAADLIRGAAFTVFTITLSAASTAVATIVSLYQQFVQPFTGHGGLGMRDGPGRWKRRARTWKRRK